MLTVMIMSYLRFNIFQKHDFNTLICSAIGNSCQANQEELESFKN